MRRLCRLLASIWILVSGALAPGLADETGRKGAPSAFHVKDFETLLYRVLEVTRDRHRAEPAKGQAVTTIHGRVLDAMGEPIRSAKIALGTPRSHVDVSFRVNLDVTDEQGRFLVQGLPRQRRLLVSTPEFSAWEVALDGTERDVDVRLPALSSLRLEPGDGWPSERLLLTPLRGDVGGGFPATSSEIDLRDGPVVRDIMPGHYRLVSTKTIETADGAVSSPRELATFVADPGKTLQVLPAANHVKVRGRVLGLPEDTRAIQIVLGAGVLAPYESRVYDTVILDGDHRFETTLPTGPCVVEIRHVKPLPGLPGLPAPTGLLRTVRITIPDEETWEFEVPVRAPPPTSTAEAVLSILDDEPARRGRDDPRVGALGALSDRAGMIAELGRLLVDPGTSWDRVQLVVRALGELPPGTPSTVAALIQGLDTPHLEFLHGSIARSLVTAGADSPEALARLTRLYREERFIRAGPVVALGMLGEASATARKQVVETLRHAVEHDPDCEARQWAADYLGRLDAEDASPLLVRLLRDEVNARTRATMAWSVVRLTNDGIEAALPTLIEVLAGEDLDGAWTASMALAGLDARAKAAIPALEARAAFDGRPPFRSEDDSLRWRIRANATRALRSIRESAAK